MHEAGTAETRSATSSQAAGRHHREPRPRGSQQSVAAGHDAQQTSGVQRSRRLGLGVRLYRCIQIYIQRRLRMRMMCAVVVGTCGRRARRPPAVDLLLQSLHGLLRGLAAARVSIVCRRPGGGRDQCQNPNKLREERQKRRERKRGRAAPRPEARKPDRDEADATGARCAQCGLVYSAEMDKENAVSMALRGAAPASW